MLAYASMRIWHASMGGEVLLSYHCTNVDLSHNSRIIMNREYVSDVDTSTDSDAELHYTAKCALRTCKCCCAPADVPPAQVPPADFKPVCSDADTKKCNHGEGIIRNKQSPLICSNHQV